MKYIIFISYFLIISSLLLSQEDSHRIALPVNYANDFEFICNNHGKACLFLDLNESYCIILLDSNYQVLAEFKDKFYTSKTPEFVGSIANEDRFELFFKRVEDDILLVLIIDTDLKELTRVKDFKITEQSHEKIIYTGSNLTGNKMVTLSFDHNSFIYKMHYSGLKTENKHVQFKDDDRKFIKDAVLTYFESHSDSLILLFRAEKVTEKNPWYRIYHLNLTNGLYQSIDVSCGQKKRQPYLHARYYKNTVLLENCDKKIMLFNSKNGELIKEFSIDFDSIIENKDIKIFTYCYAEKFYELGDPRQYDYVEGEERYGIRKRDRRFDFHEDSTNVYLEIKSKILLGSYVKYYKYYRTFLPFDWENKEIIIRPPAQKIKFDDYIINEIDKQVNAKAKITGYFIGFENKIMFGYLPKNSREFIIEKPDF